MAQGRLGFAAELPMGLLEFDLGDVSRPKSLRARAAAVAATLDRHDGWRAAMLVAASWAGLEAILYILSQAVFFDDGWAVCWPMAGIVTAVLLRMERRNWPWVLLGYFLGELHSERHDPAGQMLTIGVCNVAEVVIAAYALPAFRSLGQWMKEPGLLGRFIAIPVLLGPAATALPIAVYFSEVRHKSFWLYATRWGFGDTLGVVLWLPLMLALLSPETYDLFRRKALPQTAALLGLAVGASLLVFDTKRAPPAFILMPILLLIALRIGLSGAALAVNAVAVIATEATLRGRGPFPPAPQQDEDYRIFTLQVFLSLSMLMCLPVSVVLLEREGFAAGLKAALRRMQLLATEDGLTGVANRRRLDETLEEEWRRAMRERTPLALLMIDVDCFKLYNDTYGHLGGDDCLRRVAQAILPIPVRGGDLVARYGGEEFAVLLPNTEAAGAAEMAEQIRFAVEALGLEHERNPHRVVTISVGCSAVVPTPGSGPQTLIHGADRALYLAKQNGRNRAIVGDFAAAGRAEEKPVSANA